MSKLESKIKRLDSKIRTCSLCPLCQTRKNAVPGDGRIENLDLMFVGEGPGRFEDEAGKPFVGAAGKILDSVLKDAGLERENVYITNIVKCRPPKNRKPLPNEVKTCTSNYLQKQIELLKPKLICTLGATALQHFTGETSMKDNHGRLFRLNGLDIVPTYHPAAILRNRSAKGPLLKDIKRLTKMMERLGKE